MVARHFMYKQVYMHSIRRVYDIHLKDFLRSWLPKGRFSVDLEHHLAITDVEVLSAIRKENGSQQSKQHEYAERIECREHFHLLYVASPKDKEGGKLKPGKLQPGRLIAEAAEKEFGKKSIRYDYFPPKIPAPEFPVRMYDGMIESSLKVSQILANMPSVEVDAVYCDKKLSDDARAWRDQNKSKILGLK